MKNKIFTRIIITTLLCAFLTFSVGKVTRVSAVGTTAAIAGTAFLLTGAVYLSYVALTQGELVLPAANELHNYLGSIGRKVSQYPSGAAAYQDIYQGLLRDPIANVIDGVWTWTQDRIKDFVNDFSDTRIISEITEYTANIDVSVLPTNGFAYEFDFVGVPEIVFDGTNFWNLSDLTMLWKYTGTPVVYVSPANGLATILPSNYSGSVRNAYENGVYTPQKFVNGTWQNITDLHYGYGKFDAVNYVNPDGSLNYYVYTTNQFGYSSAVSLHYPLFANERIYDVANDEYLPLVVPEATQQRLPSWVDPDNDNRPIIPWVPIPDIPSGVTPPSGYIGQPQWGFPLANLLDLLEELAEGLINIDAIARLINEFAGQHGDNYYLEYNDGDTNYYTYYQPTIFDNDTEYVTYNINIAEQEEVIPVDLNTISLYTDNRYLDQIKQSAINGSSMLRDLAVFWHDVDPEVTYIVFGCCILILIGAFTGKLGHS